MSSVTNGNQGKLLTIHVDDFKNTNFLYIDIKELLGQASHNYNMHIFYSWGSFVAISWSTVSMVLHYWSFKVEHVNQFA